jgi:carbamoyltransferase
MPRTLSNDRDGMRGAYLGPSFLQPDIEQRLKAAGAHFSVLDETTMLDAASTALAEEKAVGWFQGRMEFGPRALGARSILGDPRSPRMQKMLNLKVKYRESFRPLHRRCCARKLPTGSRWTWIHPTCCWSPQFGKIDSV